MKKILTFLTALSMLLFILPISGFASDTDLGISVMQDGTASFDGNDLPGNDSGPNNALVRSQDSVRYKFDWSVNGSDDTNVRITSSLPAGASWAVPLPNACKTSGLTPPSSVSPNGRELVCNLGNISQGSSGALEPVVNIGSQIRDGETFDVSFNLLGDSSASKTSSIKTIEVSSSPKVEIRKNYKPVLIDRVTNPNTSETGSILIWPITVEVGGSGKGSEEIVDPVLFTDDTSQVAPNAKIVDWPLEVTQGSGIFLPTCGPWSLQNDQVPYGRPDLGLPVSTPKNSTKNSGTWNCNQVGSDINVSVTGAALDSSEFPNFVGNIEAFAPSLGGRKIYISGGVATFIPDSDIDAMNLDQNGGVSRPFNLNHKNTISSLNVVGVSGNSSTVDDPTNNTSDANVIYTNPGNWGSWFESPYNEAMYSSPVYTSGGPWRDSRPPFIGGGENSQFIKTQTQGNYSGDGLVSPGDEISYFMSRQYFDQDIPEAAMCMKIDTNTLELIDRNSWERRNISLAGPLFGYSSSKVTIPGEGPTIVRGTNEWDYNTVQTGATLTSFPPYNSTDWVEGVDFLIEYGTGSYADATAKAQTQCDAADSPDGWFTDRIQFRVDMPLSQKSG